MRPRLPPGSLVIAERLDASHLLGAGDVVVTRRPGQPEHVIVKRIHSIDQEGTIFLLGDNPDVLASTDSRSFGTVRRAEIQARILWRLWPLPPGRV